MNAKEIGIVGLVSMLIAACMMVPAGAQQTSVFIYGYAFDTENEPVNNPNVTVTNLDTGDVFTAETNASSNYFRSCLRTAVK